MYGDWGNWSECSAALSRKTDGYFICDGKGLRKRKKSLLRSPSFAGQLCNESSEEKENCTLPKTCFGMLNISKLKLSDYLTLTFIFISISCILLYFKLGSDSGSSDIQTPFLFHMTSIAQLLLAYFVA